MISLKAVRQAGVPIVVVETADATQTMLSVLQELNGKKDGVPVLRWDIQRALVGLNDAGSDFINETVGENAQIATQNPSECLGVLAKVPGKALVFLLNAHLFWANESVLQGIWNLRDTYKSLGATLVLLCLTAATLPEELKTDSIVLEDTLPSETELAEVVKDVLDAAKERARERGKDPKVFDSIPVERLKDSLLGLSAFAAENTLAMSCSSDGVNETVLSQRQLKALDMTKGLSVYRGKETLKDLVGMKNAVGAFSKVIAGADLRAIVFVDEVEKAMAGSRTDSSGVTQDQMKAFLSYMQDNEILGALLLGPPGTGKTFLCKCLANEHKIPLVMVDLGAAKGSLVGQSEQTVRQMLKVIQSLTGGKVLFIGACNRTETLPPELRRRFNFLSFFCDLADEAEKQAAWKLYRSRYDVPMTDKAAVKDIGWTAAEIKNCCLKASIMGLSLEEAAQTIVPISISASGEVTELRKSASGKYISANYAGTYRFTDGASTIGASRKMEV